MGTGAAAHDASWACIILVVCILLDEKHSCELHTISIELHWQQEVFHVTPHFPGLASSFAHLPSIRIDKFLLPRCEVLIC